MQISKYIQLNNKINDQHVYQTIHNILRQNCNITFQCIMILYSIVHYTPMTPFIMQQSPSVIKLWHF